VGGVLRSKAAAPLTADQVPITTVSAGAGPDGLPRKGDSLFVAAAAR
jgi:hypothetical protein